LRLVRWCNALCGWRDDRREPLVWESRFRPGRAGAGALALSLRRLRITGVERDFSCALGLAETQPGDSALVTDTLEASRFFVVAL